MKTYEVQKPAALEIDVWGEAFHKTMLEDTQRMKAFEDAIKEVVIPGSVVVDLGTGTGILAKWALEAGAARVYGIEVNSSILDIALSNLSGFGDRFIPMLGNSLHI
jgi:protein arginine N-methyltransferase 1